MTIKDKLYFSYAGVKSTDFGIYNVALNSGMQQEIFAPSRELKEVKIEGKDKPYFQSIEKSPLQFDVSFAFEERWNQSKIREVARWLTEQNYYQELYFSDENDNPECLYYALVTGDSALMHNMLSQGYVTLTFRCDGAYGYSPFKMNKIYDWTAQNLTMSIVDFSSGEYKNTKFLNNKVLLDSSANLKTWMDYPETMTWLDF